MSVIDSLRYAEDICNAIDCILGENPYETYLTVVTNEQIGFSDPSTTATRTDTRITIADGYRSYVDDGYLNPGFIQKSGVVEFAAQGALSSNEFMLGPLVLPYSLPPAISGGIDPSVFQPNGNNLHYMIWLKGPGLNPTNGNYFDIKEIVVDWMNNLNYFLRLQASSSTPVLPPTI